MRHDGHRYPDFIIAGAPRSGTTWLRDLADLHPDIAMAVPAIPEPKFFNVDELYARGLSYYAARWFDPLPETAICGEKSANYLERAIVAERIHQNLPTVKLVFVLRNPVDRAFSNFLWSTQNGHEREPSFARALELEAERESCYDAEVRFARPFSYFSRGLYAELLEPYLRFFGRERILVLRTEDIAQEPSAAATRFFRFLNVDPDHVRADGLGVVNGVVDRGTVLSGELRRSLASRYAEPNRVLAELLGPSFSVWQAEEQELQFEGSASSRDGGSSRLDSDRC